MKRAAAGLALLVLAGGAATAQAPEHAAQAPAAVETLRFYGYAFDLDSGAHLYTEVHRQDVRGERWLGGTIRYHRPDGSLIGSKWLDFADDRFVPEYVFELADGSYREAITDNGDPVRMQRRDGRDARLEEGEVPHRAQMCADSGFHSYLHAHFAELLDGRTLDFRLAVAGSLDDFAFRARRIGDGRFEDRPAVRFRVEPDSLLRFVVDPLELSYDPQTRRLLEYRGISDQRDPATGQPYEVRIAYYSKPPEHIAALPPLILEPEPACALSSPPFC